MLFERATDQSRALVALNASEKAVTFSVKGAYTNALTGTRVEGILELAPRSGAILEAVI